METVEPGVNFVKVIRCEECAMGECDINYFGEKCVICHNPMNGVANVWHKPNWYCGDGKMSDEKVTNK